MKRILLILATLCLLLIPAVPATSTLAYNPLDPACKNLTEAQKAGTVCSDASNQAANPNDNPVVNTITKATKIISMIIGVASVVLVTVSGLTLVLSGGNPESVKKSKSRIIGAIVGVVVSATAWLLASFVLTKL